MCLKFKIYLFLFLLTLIHFENIKAGTYGGPPITTTTTTTTTAKSTTVRSRPGFFSQFFLGNRPSDKNPNNSKKLNKTQTYDEFIQKQTWPRGYYPIPPDALTPPDPYSCPPGQRPYRGKCRTKWANG